MCQRRKYRTFLRVGSVVPRHNRGARDPIIIDLFDRILEMRQVADTILRSL